MKLISLLIALLLLIKCSSVPYNSPLSTTGKSESNEFKTLTVKDQISKEKKNAAVLTYLLNDSNFSEKNTAAIVENHSGCNIIVRMVGISSQQIYNLPVAANSKNQFVIQKGSYTVKSRICGGNYYSQKNVNDVLILKLSIK